MRPKKGRKWTSDGIDLDVLQKDIIEDLLNASKPKQEKKNLLYRGEERKRKRRKDVEKMEWVHPTNSAAGGPDSPQPALATGSLPGSLSLGEQRLLDVGSADGALTFSPNHKKRREPEVIVFDDPAKRAKKPGTSTTATFPKTTKSTANAAPTQTQSDSSQFVNLRDAKFDVFKYYMKGLKPEQAEKEEARASMAVKLGAKPAKGKHTSIKDYMTQREQQTSKETALARQKKSSYGGKLQRDNRKDRKRKGPKDVTGFSFGKVGHYKGGVLHVSKEHIQSFRKNKH